MIAPDSERSSADSTAATTAGESCSPHGVRSPNEWLNHFAEVDRRRLLDERAVVVVDPVARERAGADELVARGAVGVDRQGERRPRDRRPELDERLVRDRPRRRQAHPAADGLDEARRRLADLRLVLDVGKVDGREAHRRRPDAHGRRADMALAEVAGVHDPAVLDLDERPQLVGLAEPVGRAEVLEVLELVRAAARRSG